MTRKEFLLLSAAGGAALANAQGQGIPPRTPADDGFTDTPMEPDMPYHVHDSGRPHPKQITPATTPGGAPSDAIVLFDGKDLSKWYHRGGRGAAAGTQTDAAWKVENGYFEVTPGHGDLLTREKFGDVQLHVEWTSPTVIQGNSQGRGNSGVLLQARYEIQVLDMWDNPTYADGGAGAIYGQWPPLVTPAKRPGEWNTYDIVFEAPKFNGDQLVKPAFFTVFYNGVMVHNRKQSLGPMVYRQVAHYTPQPEEDSLMLQYHNNPVRYRNIWIRRLGGYDQPEKA
ncbi:MAG TPA: DUF1080 domain-containing protein [Bryobacteraceae bacterium]|nr:DUF1080 domain-containing protein [Bryobacteraceae bacterium]